MTECELCYKQAHEKYKKGDISIRQIPSVVMSLHMSKSCLKIKEDREYIEKGMKNIDEAFNAFRNLNHDPLRDEHALKWGLADLMLMVHSVCLLILTKEN